MRCIDLTVGNWKFWLFRPSSSSAWIPDGRLYKRATTNTVGLVVHRCARAKTDVSAQSTVEGTAYTRYCIEDRGPDWDYDAGSSTTLHAGFIASRDLANRWTSAPL